VSEGDEHEQPAAEASVAPQQPKDTARPAEGGKEDEEDSRATELFEQYWRYTTNLRNWFIAYGVGGILLLTRADAIFNSPTLAQRLPSGVKVEVVSFFLFGLATQVLLTLYNKVIHYYSYQAYLVDRQTRRHRIADWLCGAFVVDFGVDLTTFAFYVYATFLLKTFL
jgi:hypothetical protein